MHWLCIICVFILCICASKGNDALASERSIFSKNVSYKKIFPCHAEPLHTYIWVLDSHGGHWWQRTRNRHTRDNYSNTRSMHMRDIIGGTCGDIITVCMAAIRYFRGDFNFVVFAVTLHLKSFPLEI